MERIRNVIKDLGVQLKAMQFQGLETSLDHEKPKEMLKPTGKSAKRKKSTTFVTPPLSRQEHAQIDKMLKTFRDDASLPIDEIMSDEFKLAYHNFFLEIHNAKGTQWKTTTQETALRVVNVLNDIIKS